MSNTQEGFKPIESQEELDRIIKDRISRAEKAVEKRFDGWVSPDDHQKALADVSKAFDDFKKVHESDEKTIADLTAKNKVYETASLKSRIAHEVGLSYDWISRISGDDEASIRADAESLKKLVGKGSPIPTKNTESGENVDSGTAAYRSVLNGLKNT